MNEYNVIVPRLDWLIGGSRIGTGYNRYYGSLGTDPLKGCIGQRIFNYSIWIEKKEDCEEEVIKAACYYGTASFDNTPSDEITVSSFPAEESSLEEIRAWLCSMAERFFSEQ